MSRFIKHSNLPEGEVTSLIFGGVNPQLTNYFEKRGIEILRTKENTYVDKSVSRHADISALYLGEGKIIVDKRQNDLISKLRNMGFYVIETTDYVEGNYPRDCILNHTLMSEYIIGNSKIFDESVVRNCNHLEIINTKQGYCKCSVLVVDRKSIITDDESIALNVRKKGIDCLLISKGDVFLDGHEYGFIGGASGKISRDEIVFFGDISKHSDYFEIKEFTDRKGIKIIGFDFPLTDFGGTIPIKEKVYKQF